MKHYAIYTSFFTTVSCMGLLSGCYMVDQAWSDMTEERVGQSVSEGARRAPLLNPPIHAAARPSPSSVRPPAAQPQKPTANAYDYYDASGNPVGEETELASMSSDNEPTENFFSGMADKVGNAFSGSTKSEAVRKPLMGNPHYVRDTEATAPIPPAPNTVTPMVKPAKETAAYPALSSVPPKPEQFKAAQETKQEKIDALKTERALAEQEKQQLEAETPSVAPAVAAPVVSKPAEPALLGHAQAPVETIRDLYSEELAAGQTPAQPEMKAAVAEPEALPQPDEKPWWERWSVFSREEEASAPPPVQVEAPPVSPAPVAAPLMAQPEKPSELPSLTASDAMIVEADDAQVAAANEQDESALPSPGILQKTKILPPSRYSARARSAAPAATH